jgi:hypothetical protein
MRGILQRIGRHELGSVFEDARTQHDLALAAKAKQGAIVHR